MFTLDWTNKDSLKLISEYRNHSVLWDKSVAGYKNKFKRIDAWTDIANKFGCSKSEVERKMNVLLTQYRREKHKIMMRYYEYTDDPYRSSWYAFHEFSFLEDYKARQQNREVVKYPLTFLPHPYNVGHQETNRSLLDKHQQSYISHPTNRENRSFPEKHDDFSQFFQLDAETMNNGELSNIQGPPPPPRQPPAPAHLLPSESVESLNSESLQQQNLLSPMTDEPEIINNNIEEQQTIDLRNSTETNCQDQRNSSSPPPILGHPNKHPSPSRKRSLRHQINSSGAQNNLIPKKFSRTHSPNYQSEERNIIYCTPRIHKRKRDRKIYENCKKLKSNIETLAAKVLKEDDCDHLGANVTLKLREMDKSQRIIAEKLIADVIFYGQINQLKVNASVCPGEEKSQQV